MKVQWEKRGTKYFAYLHHTYYVQDMKKGETLNKYLGGTITKAIESFKEFAANTKDISFSEEDITNVVLYLKNEGLKLGIKWEKDIPFNRRQFLKHFKPYLKELEDSIMTANTKDEKDVTIQKLHSFFDDINKYLQTQKKDY
jgi:hypothetical protein